jgi:hypothetical protein
VSTVQKLPALTQWDMVERKRKLKRTIQQRHRRMGTVTKLNYITDLDRQQARGMVLGDTERLFITSVNCLHCEDWWTKVEALTEQHMKMKAREIFVAHWIDTHKESAANES